MKKDVVLIGNKKNLLWIEKNSGAVKWLSVGAAETANKIPMPAPIAAESSAKTYFHTMGSSPIAETVFSSAENVCRIVDFFSPDSNGIWIRLIEPMKGQPPLRWEWPSELLQASGKEIPIGNFKLFLNTDIKDLLKTEVVTLNNPIVLALSKEESETINTDPTAIVEKFLETEKHWKSMPLPKPPKGKLPSTVVSACQSLRLIAAYLSSSEEFDGYLTDPIPNEWQVPFLSPTDPYTIRLLARTMEILEEDGLSEKLFEKIQLDNTLSKTDENTENIPLEMLQSYPLPNDSVLAEIIAGIYKTWTKERDPKLEEAMSVFPPEPNNEQPVENSSSEKKILSAHLLARLIHEGFMPWDQEAWRRVKKWLQQNGNVITETEANTDQGQEERKISRHTYRSTAVELACTRGDAMTASPLSVRALTEAGKKLGGSSMIIPTLLGPDRDLLGLLPDPACTAMFILAWTAVSAKVAESAESEEPL